MDEQELDEDEVMERAESILGQQFGTDQAVNNLYEHLPDEARRRLLSDTILTAESARKVEKEVKAIIRAELQLNQKKKMLLFKADKEKKELEEKTQFLKNRTEFLEEENNSLEDANALLKDERDRLLPIEREFNKLRHQNEQLEIRNRAILARNDTLVNANGQLENTVETQQKKIAALELENRRLQQARGNRSCEACGTHFDGEGHRKIFFPRCNHTVGAACAPRRRNGEYKCPLEHNF
ncbi:unnamed protein product [Oikopleura dioica]|uniref:Uncharacterized protein n=1 Tax=Oikopleura dioica TaxID=34765 RepID=E4YPQ0_OIKDI|nr:unnamed protein product [Oikopleura dioica]